MKQKSRSLQCPNGHGAMHRCHITITHAKKRRWILVPWEYCPSCGLMIQSALTFAHNVHVPLDLTITVVVSQGYRKEKVEAALLEKFSDRVLADGSYGFFHSKNLAHGMTVQVSSIIALAGKVTGAEWVSVKLKRVSDPDSRAITNGNMLFGADEIPQLANDPQYPDLGIVRVICLPEGI